MEGEGEGELTPPGTQNPSMVSPAFGTVRRRPLGVVSTCLSCRGEDTRPKGSREARSLGLEGCEEKRILTLAQEDVSSIPPQ